MTIFSDPKDELETILTEHLVTPGTIKVIRKFRSYDFDQTPLLVIMTDGYDERTADEADEIDITLVTITKFSGQSEEEAAETVLDTVDDKLVELFRKDGDYQVNPGKWGAVDFPRRSIRPPSPFDAGYRYSEFYLRFIT